MYTKFAKIKKIVEQGVFWCFNEKKNGEDDWFYESTNKTDLRNHTDNNDLYTGFPYINIHIMDPGMS